MIKSDILCKGCGNTFFIQNKTHHLCSECSFKRNHGGKSRREVYLERSRANKKNKVGEIYIFKEIWSERHHYCVNCGKFLGHEVKSYFFSHIKSKGAYPELKYNKDNIELLCFDCHYKYEFGDRNK